MEANRANSDGVTELLGRWSGGDEAALHELTPIIYQELLTLARHYMRQERKDHTLQPTALVHELFIRLFGANPVSWENRSHFLNVAAKLMRQMLVDHARRRLAAKRNGDGLEMRLFTSPSSGEEVLSIDQALRKLEALDHRKARVVELKYFGGLTIEETADSLSVSVSSVERDWTLARAWLFRELQLPPKNCCAEN